MRIQFEFHISGLPRAYRLGILSIIKEMLRQGSEEYYEQIFEIHKRGMKPFGHASYIKNLKITSTEIIGKKLILTISSPFYEFIMHLVNGSQRNNTYTYQGYKFELKHKRMLPNPPEFSSNVSFKTLSPILIETHQKKPLLANDHSFEDEFNYYSQLLVNELYGRNLHKPIKILNSSMKKIVIQENLHQAQTTPVFITANHGFIQLKGHPEDLKALYDNGAGRRRSLGLGLLEVQEVTY